MTKELVKEWTLIIVFTATLFISSCLIAPDYPVRIRLLCAGVLGVAAYLAYVIVESAIKIKQEERVKREQEINKQKAKKMMEELLKREESDKK